MSDRKEGVEGAPATPNIVLTPDERRVFGQLFQAADVEGTGIVTGDVAVKFFKNSGLDPRILGEIWGIADTENKGFLEHVGFSVALRLIGQAQNGQHPRPELAAQPGPLPKFEGLNIQYPPPRKVPPTTATPPTGPVPNPTDTGVVRVPPLKEADVKKFTELFQISGAVDGVLPGELAKGIFQRAQLPYVTLGMIWNLADTQQRGALGPAEFVIAMHLINCCKNGTLTALPSVLPPGLYEVASGRAPAVRGAPPPDRRPQTRGYSPVPGAPAVPPIPKQFSGPQVRAQSPLSRQYTPPMTLPVQTSGDWAVTPREKQEFDQLFAQVDKSNKGFITGEEAVPFFSNSKLPEDILAQIWDLADIKKAGRLTRDEFAIAMHLIRQQRSRRDGNVGLPDTLPSNLVPPSMRGTVPPPTAQPTSMYDPPPPVPAPKPSEDLFGLGDAFGPPASAAPPAVGASPTFSPFETGAHISPAGTGQSNIFSGGPNLRQFVPQSQFGQSIISTQTGASTQSKTPSALDDLLGDTDPEVSKKLTAESAEIANLTNQVNSLSKKTQELQQKRLSSEQDLGAVNAQKQEIQGQLNRLRGLYEREAAEVQRIHEQLTASRADTARLRQEYALIQSQYQDLQGRRTDMLAALEADKRENAELKERVAQLTAENKSLQAQLEKLRIDGKQQRGFVAIGKKQLSTAEQERDRLKQDIEDARSVSSPVPGSPTPSHASTATTHTNPFAPGYRRAPSAASEAAFTPSQFAPSAQNTNTTIEEMFGPQFAAQRSSPAPQVGFGTPKQAEAAPQHGSEELGHSTPPTSPPASHFHGSPRQQVQQLVHQAQNAGGSGSRPDTPTNWTGSAPEKGQDIFGKPRRTSMSVKSDAGTESSAKPTFPFEKLEKNTTGSTTGGMEKKRDSFSAYSSNSNPLSSLPGAFPGSDVNSPIKPTATGESTMSRDSTKPSQQAKADPFHLAGPKDDKPSSAQPDFDKVFQSFGLPKQNTGNSNISASRVNAEFPPIEVLQEDDGSDTESEKGFEDDFTGPTPAAPAAPAQSSTPAVTSPPPTTNAPGKEEAKLGHTLTGGSNAPIPAPSSNFSQSSAFPALERHNTAGSTGGSLFGTPGGTNTGANLFPSPPPAASAGSALFPSPQAAQNTGQNTTTDDAFDDDAFADLADAKEEDTKNGNDDFTLVGSRDATFGDDFDDVFDSPAQNPIRQPSGANTNPGFDFGFQQPVQAASSQVWDAIFADFGDNKNAAGNPQQQTINEPIPGPPLQTDNSPAPTGPTTGAVEQNTTGQGASGASGETELKPEEERKLTEMISMGFSREKSLEALKKFSFNVAEASNYAIDNP